MEQGTNAGNGPRKLVGVGSTVALRPLEVCEQSSDLCRASDYRGEPFAHFPGLLQWSTPQLQLSST